MRRVQPMKRLITEKARREALRPTASIRKTALRDPNKAPIARRLPTTRICVRGLPTDKY